MSSQSQIQIELCSDEDIATCTDVVSRSFGHDAPFMDIYFPNHDTPSGQKKISQRILKWKRSSEGSTFMLKAVITPGKTQTKQIIGFGIWTLMTNPPTIDSLEEDEDVEGTWPDEEDREYMRRSWKDYIVPRAEAVRKAGEKGVFVLELLAVDPDFQRRGAGKGLITWGTKVADERGVDSVVEGTPKGKAAYESCGFRVEIERMKFDQGVRFTNRRPIPLIFLRRKREST